MDFHAGNGWRSPGLYNGFTWVAFFRQFYCRIPDPDGNVYGKYSLDGHCYTGPCFFSFIFLAPYAKSFLRITNSYGSRTGLQCKGNGADGRINCQHCITGAIPATGIGHDQKHGAAYNQSGTSRSTSVKEA